MYFSLQNGKSGHQLTEPQRAFPAKDLSSLRVYLPQGILIAGSVLWVRPF
jgi:hypothetical protein